MSDANSRQQETSLSSRFVRGAGEVQDKKLWGPAKWVVQLIQYMIAIIMLTIGEGIKSIFTGERVQKRKDREEAVGKTD